MKTVRILLLEDNVVDSICFKDALAEVTGTNFAVTHVETLAEAKQNLGNGDFHVVVADLGLPDAQGLETFAGLRNSAPGVPIVVFSGLDDDALAMEAVRKGAQDYVRKDQWDGQVLSRTIHYAIERHRLLTETLGLVTQGKGKATLVEDLIKIRDSALSAASRSLPEEAAHVSDTSHISPNEIGRLIHELQVHRIELEIQNEELREAQIELEKSREEYSDLYEFAPVGYFTLDARGVVLKANLTGTRLVAQARSFLLNKPFAALLSKDDANIFYSHLREVFRSHSSQTCELRLVRDDSISYVRLESVAVKGSERGDQCRTIVTDITDLKRSEETLRQNEQRFRAIFEGADDFIFIKDRKLRFIQVNPAFERLAGLPASEIIGRTHEDVFGKDSADFIKTMELRALAGETVEDEHSKIIRGMPLSFLATRTPLRDSSGEIVVILNILHDITDRKRGETSLVRTKVEYPSEAMRATLKQAEMVAKRASTILLTGESGSGKDYLAKYIHNRSDRANGPYFSINCAAIAPELAESELFGHEKGSFTGAVNRKRGLLELAEGGTLLLNEIGELSLHLQAKLLTFLDTRRFTRVGGEKEISVSARLIAATNRDLETAAKMGTFRKDLLYRIDVLSIAVPPLRERTDDVPLLVQEILAKICDEMQIHTRPAISLAAMEVLQRYDWPGNVRELRNALERALILSHGKEIRPSDLGIGGERVDTESKHFSASFPNTKSLNEVTRDLKRFMVNEALRKSGGSRQGAAKLLGISRYSLKHYMQTLGYDEDKTQE